MRLIDAEPFEAFSKDGIDYEGDCLVAYVAGMEGVLEAIDSAPAIDPVHAAGGCYCRECRYCGVPVFTEGVLLCRRGNRPERKNRDDFCSRGKLKEEE